MFFCAALLLISVAAFGQSAGFNNTFIVLSVNGGGNTYYDLNASTTNPDFQGANLGAFCEGSSGIVFKGAEHNVYKCGGCDLTSTRIYYRIYPGATATGSFMSNSIGYSSGFNNGCGGQDQQWSNTAYSTNLLSGLAPGSYTVEVYSDASVTCSGGTVYAGNGGANYKATFTVNATVTYFADTDGDGFGDPSVSQTNCTGQPAGYVANAADCDDTQVFYFDNDGDGSGSDQFVACEEDGVPNSDDCDDDAFTFADLDGDGFGGQDLVACGGVYNNEDCDDAQLVYEDLDADGFGSDIYVACPESGVLNSGDCNDGEVAYEDLDGDGFGSQVFAACNGVANIDDCDDSLLFYQDLDGDGFGSDVAVACAEEGVSNDSDCDDTLIAFEDLDGDGFGSLNLVPCGGVGNSVDCDDTQLVYEDSDGDGFGSGTYVACAVNGVLVAGDCDDSQLTYLDADGDGLGSDTLAACGVLNSDDCNDGDPFSISNTYYADSDADGFGDPSASVFSCTQPEGYVTDNTDCNDNDTTVHESFTFFVDQDGDTYGSTSTMSVCTASANVAPTGYSLVDTDCDDGNASTHTSSILFIDADGDGYDDGSIAVCHGQETPQGFSFTSNGTDCDDTDANIFTSSLVFVDDDGDEYDNGAITACHGVAAPEGYSFTTNGTDCNDDDDDVYQNGSVYVDSDGDSYNNGNSEIVCYGASVPAGYIAANNGIDCDDNDANVNPAATEVLGNGIDDNCNGETDEGNPILTQLLPSQCGTTLPTLSSLIGAVSTSNATAYRFRVINTATNAVQTIVKNVPYFQITALPSYDYATAYSIDVELQINTVWQGAYGAGCVVSTPQVLGTGGAASVIPSQCGSTIPTISTLIATTSLPGVTGYRFRITNTTDVNAPNQVQTIDRTTHWFALTMLNTFTYGTTYSIEVAIKTTGTYTAFGAPCTVTTPAVPTLAAYCNGVIPSASTNIPTVSLDRVTSYRFEVTNLNDFSTTVINRSVHWFPFASIPGYVPGGLYAVRVALLTSGVWSLYGEACMVTAPAAARVAVKDEEIEPGVDFRAVAYPNPYAEGFALDMDTPASDKVHVKVYDMTGRLLEDREFAADQIEMQQFGERYPSGVYNVIVAQAAFVKTLRVIKR